MKLTKFQPLKIIPHNLKIHHQLTYLQKYCHPSDSEAVISRSVKTVENSLHTLSLVFSKYEAQLLFRKQTLEHRTGVYDDMSKMVKNPRSLCIFLKSCFSINM